jgi:nifR3 family TIM-barrel protein
MKNMKIGKIELENNLMLAPMQNVTTAPYRRFCRKLSSIGLVSVPMIYTKRIETHPQSILIDLYKIEEERPISIQLIGSDKISLKKSIDFLSSYNFDFLDINAGCPSKRAIRAQEGGFLIKNLDKLKLILDTAVKYSSRPVSVKIRTGFNSAKELIGIMKVIEDSGVELVSIHSRTVKDRYDNSKFDIEAIKRLKATISIPVVGNGDIDTPQKAKNVFDYTKVDGIMIGRASMGNPRIFNQISSFLNQDIIIPIENNLAKMKENLILYEEIIDEMDYTTYFSNIEDLNKFKFSELKRNAIWLTRFIENSRNIRIKLSKSKSLNDLKSILKTIFSNYVISSGALRIRAT